LSGQIAHGETPDVVRNSAILKGMNIPRTGQTTYNVGTLVTKTLVIAGEGTSPLRRIIRAARCFALTTKRPAKKSARFTCLHHRPDLR